MNFTLPGVRPMMLFILGMVPVVLAWILTGQQMAGLFFSGDEHLYAFTSDPRIVDALIMSLITVSPLLFIAGYALNAWEHRDETNEAIAEGRTTGQRKTVALLMGYAGMFLLPMGLFLMLALPMAAPVMLKTHYEDIATFFSNPWNIVGVVCLLPFFVLRSIAKVEVINGIGKFHARLSGKREKA